MAPKRCSQNAKGGSLGQSKLTSFLSRQASQATPSCTEGVTSSAMEAESSPIVGVAASESEARWRKVDMQAFHASLQRTNPIAEEIADDLHVFMQTRHTQEEFEAKLREAMNTYKSIQRVPGAWKFQVHGKAYEILDAGTPTDEVESSMPAAVEALPVATVMPESTTANNVPCDFTDQEASMPASVEENLRVCSASSEEQPLKRTRLTSSSPTRTLMEKADIGSDTSARIPSLRERLLARMGREGAATPLIPNPEPNADSDTHETRDHKTLGGLSFKWKLLFHAGSKPVSKGTASAASGSGSRPPRKATNHAVANVAGEVSRGGA